MYRKFSKSVWGVSPSTRGRIEKGRGLFSAGTKRLTWKRKASRQHESGEYYQEKFSLNQSLRQVHQLRRALQKGEQLALVATPGLPASCPSPWWARGRLCETSAAGEGDCCAYYRDAGCGCGTLK